MPRKKLPLKFKYTYRKGDNLFVVYPLPSLKYLFWRKCEPETQERVNELIAEIKTQYAKAVKESEIPTRCDKFIAFWLDQMKSRVSERTLQGYESIARRYLIPHIGVWEFNEIRPVNLELVYQQMLNNNLHAQTIRHTHAVAVALFAEAVNLELITTNPAKKAKPPRLPRSLKIKIMNQAEVKRFLSVCRENSHG